ncbi:MAG: 16S rRNA (uracil(1498)-N(3))-methyltransferase [Rhodospirillaceae bacterium]|nr:16S rRNA (uracil(1498)-N(3))-methyltransferase [Rhodospirillaceae bacterium]
MSSPASPLRLFVPGDLATGLIIELSSDQAHYVAHVMRRSVGDAVLLFNGRDGEWQGDLAEIQKKAASVFITAQTQGQPIERNLTLLFAPIKRMATDMIVQKASELGVTVIQPVITARTNSDRVRVGRLTAIATEASEQCERLTLPVIFEPVSIQDKLESWPEDRVLFVMDETGTGAPIADVLSESAAQDAAAAAFVIGPEGGFSETELDLMRSLPFSRFMSLGPRILRADTAALAALTCWQALCGDWRHANKG